MFAAIMTIVTKLKFPIAVFSLNTPNIVIFAETKHTYAIIRLYFSLSFHLAYFTIAFPAFIYALRLYLFLHLYAVKIPD